MARATPFLVSLGNFSISNNEGKYSFTLRLVSSFCVLETAAVEMLSCLYVYVLLESERKPEENQYFFYVLSNVFSNSLIRQGRTSRTSPTIPKSATSNIGARGSLLIATMIFEFIMPTVWCVAPEMPAPM